MTERTVAINEDGRAPTLSVVSNAEGFDRLEPVWNALLEEADVSVFQSYEWQRTWWKHFGENNPKTSLHIIVLESGNEVVGIAPFFVEQTRTLGIIRHRRLAFVGQGPSDYLDPLCKRGYEAICAELIAKHLKSISHLFDIIHLEDCTDRLSFHALLFEGLKKRGFYGEHFVNEYCPRTILLGTWEETLASFRTPNRREVRRRDRNIHKNFSIEYEIVTSEAAAARGIDEFVTLHQQKWQNEGYIGVFAESAVAKFHRDVAQRFARRGWLMLAFMNANGQKVATLYCFAFRDDFAVYLTGNANRSDVFKFSPGRVLTAFCMEEAIRNGKKVCDFMRGTEAYKYELNAKDVPNWAILMYNPKSFQPEFRYKTDLLIRSFHRRATRERLLFQVVVKQHGLFSRGMAQHIKARFKKTLTDGKMKAKAPERATKLSEKRSSE